MINRNTKSMDKKLILESMIISDKYHLLKENENYITYQLLRLKLYIKHLIKGEIKWITY